MIVHTLRAAVNRTALLVSAILAAIGAALPTRSFAADPTTQPVAANLLPNPGFEDWRPAPAKPTNPSAVYPTYGPDGAPVSWNCSAEITPGVNDPNIKGSASVNRDQSIAHSGKSSMLLANASPTDIASAQCQTAVEPSTRYRLKCWVKGDGITSPRGDGILIWTRYGAKADFWQKNTWSANAPTPHNGTFDWKPYEFTVDTDAKAQVMHVTVQLRNAAGKAWFDDIELTKVGPVVAVESY